mmetsp:Transcript_40446/g.112350  ORF Transcript_40446/g.112350 Transcript_40446/m.112350 type:complete len:593 (-) Transcript_40446:99-1877(-)
MADWEYYGDEFYNAVEEAFMPIEREFFGWEGCTGSTKEKRRIRDKIRKVGQGLASTDDEVSTPDEMLGKLAFEALNRISAAHCQWMDAIDWTIPLAAFAAEAWPRLGTKSEIYGAAERAVQQWRASLKHDPAGQGRGEPEDHGDAALQQQAPTVSTTPMPQAFTENQLQTARRGIGVHAHPEPQSAAQRDHAAGSDTDFPARVMDPLRRVGICKSVRPADAEVPTTGLADKVSLTETLSGQVAHPDPCESMVKIQLVIDHVPLGVPLGTTLLGLQVAFIKPRSLAYGLLEKGDIIVAVNGNHVCSQTAFLAELSASRPGTVRLEVRRPQGRIPGTPQGTASSGGSWVAAASSVASSAVVGSPEAEAALPLPRRIAALGGGGAGRRAGRGCSPEPLQGATGRSGSAAVAACATFSATATDSPEAVTARPAPLTQSGFVVVLNGEDIGRKAISISPAFADCGFAWEAVGRAIAYFEEHGFFVQCVANQATIQRHPPPADIAGHPGLVLCPVIDDDPCFPERYSDRTFVLRLAETYGCHWVDNNNYRASTWEGTSSWDWLLSTGSALKVGYIFDLYKRFIPSRTAQSLMARASRT